MSGVSIASLAVMDQRRAQLRDLVSKAAAHRDSSDCSAPGVCIGDALESLMNLSYRDVTLLLWAALVELSERRPPQAPATPTNPTEGPTL